MLQNPTATFLPTQISGCQLWLDAADPTGTGTLPVGGSTLATWKDKSPNGFTGTALNSPTVQANILNGLPVIRFNGTNQYIDFGNILNLGTNGLSMFAVTKFAKPPDTIDNGGWIVGKTSYRGNYGRWGMGYDGYYSSGMTAYYEEVTTFVGPSFPFNPSTQFNLFSSQTNRTSFSRILLNGTLGAQSNFSLIPTNMSNTDSLFVASYGNSTGIAPLLTYNLNGDIAEILVYFATLTDAQRQQIEGYLAWKWGIQANLPTNHPYKVGPPYSAIFTAPSRSVGIAATWNPTLISGCQLWLDAADRTTFTLSGTTVSAWTNKVPGGITTTTVSAPSLSGNFSNKIQTFRFNSNSITATLSSAVGTGDYALFALWLTINGGTEGVLSIGPNGGPAAGIGYNGSYYNLYEWGQTESQYVAARNQYVVQSGTRISASKTVYYNGNAAASASGAVNLTNTTLYIGNGTGFPINGEIGEIIMYQGTLTTVQRQQVEGYLAWKWGLVASLPANHPFKLWPPPP
jgi:hypothetical protein